MMLLPTEPIGSIPRPTALIAGIHGFEAGRISQAELHALDHAAVHETIQWLEATGSPVITDGEQAKHSWATYAIYGLETLAPDGVPRLFADGHMRNFPRLTAGPFRYKTSADIYLEIAQRYAHVPRKQAVISTSALSLLYPPGRLPGYSRAQDLDALIAAQEGEIRRCLHKGAQVIQIDFTERSCTSLCRPASSVPSDQGAVRGAACRPQQIAPHPILHVVSGSTRRQPTRSRGESALDREPSIGSAFVRVPPRRRLAR